MKIKDVIVEAGLLKRAKDELGRIITTDDPYWWQKGGGMKKDVSALEPDAAKLRQTIGILRDKQRRKNRQPQQQTGQAQPAPAQTQQPTTATFQPRTPNVWRGRPKVIGRVVVPKRWGKRAGEIVSKTSDGWFDQQGQQITNPNAIKDLDGLLLPQLQQPKLQTRTSRIVK